MNGSFPDDADGLALRNVVEDGSDLSRPMFIDFQVAVPNEQSANELANAVRKLGYHAKVYESSECRLPWTCECSTRMLASYEGLIAVQKELAEIAAAFGGIPDGWGTFGNGPKGQPPAA
jgi:regulator of RNase E activity RraB